MLKTLKPATLAAVIAMALPAAAAFEHIGGEAGWQLAQHSYHGMGGAFMMSDDCAYANHAGQASTTPGSATEERSADGFEPVRGEAGGQLAQHVYDFVDGRFVMSDECDHAIRTALAPTTKQIESARLMSPGV